MPSDERVVIGGVDTHKDVHVGAVIDHQGRVLATASFSTTVRGYRQLLGWMGSFGDLAKVGVEGTGTYGAGLARHLSAAGISVLEVNRPNRQARRRRGKSDTADAEAAARAALNGEASGTPKSADGAVEALRALRVVRRSAVKARMQASNQIRDLIVSAPEDLRGKLVSLGTKRSVAICAAMRPGATSDPMSATKRSLRLLARRHVALSAEIDELDEVIATLCAETNRGLLSAVGVGPDVASALLVAAGDNPERMRTEGSFAALCGASPVEASSGKVTRHRLNRGGNREANNALWRIAMSRLLHDETTQLYATRRRAEGKSNKEILRCLKRYIAREVFALLTNPPRVPDGARLRVRRLSAGVTLAVVAKSLATTPLQISRLERGVLHSAELAHHYQAWLDAEVSDPAA
jgi:transposase